MTSTSEQSNRIVVCSPGTKRVVWEGPVATSGQVQQSVANAKASQQAWAAESTTSRIALAQRFAELATERHEQITQRISMETGKPHWEAAAEARLVPAKVELAIDAFGERTGGQQIELPQGIGRVRYRAAGVIAVLGPFNFPAHLPNGHIVPALIAGNAVVFKPSELTPGTGELLCELWKDAGLPDGVLQVVQGDAKVGAQLVECDVNGVFFTGSYSAGCAIHRSLAGRPAVLLALEMGGNNPLVIHQVKDLDAAAYLTVISAFVTAGQRCTCARRLILPDGERVEPLLDKITGLCNSLRVGLPDDDPQPFMGPLISPAAATRVLDAQSSMIRSGAVALLAAQRIGDNQGLISPAVIDVSTLSNRNDEEVFGPLLQVIRVPDFETALAEANRTAYGLSASLLSDNPAFFEQFRGRIRAGVTNWNQATIGASGRLPFGGLGSSGNHRPSGFFAADYCADATALLESETLSMPDTLMPGIRTTE